MFFFFFFNFFIVFFVFVIVNVHVFCVLFWVCTSCSCVDV